MFPSKCGKCYEQTGNDKNGGDGDCGFNRNACDKNKSHTVTMMSDGCWGACLFEGTAAHSCCAEPTAVATTGVMLELMFDNPAGRGTALLEANAAFFSF